MEAFQHHVVFIFNLQSSSSTISSVFDQQHLQHFDLSISNDIFSTWTFRSVTSSALWLFDQQQHLQHFDLLINNIFSIFIFQFVATYFSTLTGSISNNIFSILIFQLAMTSSALGPFDQQHLQHFDYSISNNIFSILTFWSTTSSALWIFDQQHLQHFDFSISSNIIIF